MEKKLQRNEQEKMIAGVCAGLADYFDVDVSWVRIIFVLALIPGFPGLLAYIILWIAVPPKPFTLDFGKHDADYKMYENKAYPTDPVLDPSSAGLPTAYPKKPGNARLIIGMLFIAFGLFFILSEFNLIPYWLEFHKLWPVILIVLGIYTLIKPDKKPWKPEETKNADYKTKPGVNVTGSDETKSTTDQSIDNTL